LIDFPQFRGAIHRIPNRISGFFIEAVIIIPEEATIKEDPSGDGRETTGKGGTAGSVAEKAIGVREIVEALR